MVKGKSGYMLVLRKLKILLLVFIAIVSLFFLVRTMISSIVISKINERIDYTAKVLERQTGIIIRSKGIQVSSLGKVVIKDFTASFHKNGLPFFSFSSITIKGKPEPWFTSFSITGITIDSFILRGSLDSFRSQEGAHEFLTRYFPGNKPSKSVGEQNMGNNGNGFVRLGEYIEITLLKGKVYAARHEADTFGHVPLIHSCRVSARLNSKNREVTGSLTASGSYKSDNISSTFIINPHYQSISMDIQKFSTKALISFFPQSLDVDKDSAIDARVLMYKYAAHPFVQVDIKGYVDKISVDNRKVSLLPLVHINGGVRGIVNIDVINRVITSDELIFFVGTTPLFLRNVEIRMDPSIPLFFAITLETEHLRLRDIIDSLPRGLIPHLKDTRIHGVVDISASIVVDMGDIESSYFNITGGISGFRVVSAPLLCDVRKISSMEYVHTRQLPGAEAVSIVLGPANKSFVPLRKVGRYVIESVLTCEDGNFYVHDGFQLKHVNGAIKDNLRAKRFVRGASTVSMQLVKNLFLSNEKTISRKLEEIMLTWWMEREVKKKRMLEVYLNIIEWGPGIFGIGPAAEHYFSCKPSELSLTQATWLASILINPSLFYYMKKDGKIDNSMRSMIRYVLKAINRQGGISDAELMKAEKINYEVLFP